MSEQRESTTGRSRGLANPTDERSNCGVGVVMDLDGGSSHDVVADGVELLENLEHRGTTGAEENTGDGAGVMLQTPREFFSAVVDVELPERYAVGSIFFPKEGSAQSELKNIVESVLSDYDIDIAHWRSVPTDNSDIGKTALDSEPATWQCFVSPPEGLTDDEFDKRLYVARRVVENTVEDEQHTAVLRERFGVAEARIPQLVRIRDRRRHRSELPTGGRKDPNLGRLVGLVDRDVRGFIDIRAIRVRNRGIAGRRFRCRC